MLSYLKHIIENKNHTLKPFLGAFFHNFFRWTFHKFIKKFVRSTFEELFFLVFCCFFNFSIIFDPNKSVHLDEAIAAFVRPTATRTQAIWFDITQRTAQRWTRTVANLWRSPKQRPAPICKRAKFWAAPSRAKCWPTRPTQSRNQATTK